MGRAIGGHLSAPVTVTGADIVHDVLVDAARRAAHARDRERR
ncbi:hypothetical protein AB0L06_12115 [Spirillospora sp. NPDC052269]